VAACGNCAGFPNALRSSSNTRAAGLLRARGSFGLSGFVGEWRLEGLVVLREGPFGHVGAGEKPRDALRIHDERAHAVGGVLIEL
jgi:hypothetical protein